MGKTTKNFEKVEEIVNKLFENYQSIVNWKSNRIEEKIGICSVILSIGYGIPNHYHLIVKYQNKEFIKVLPFFKENYNDDEIKKYFSYLVNIIEKATEIKDNLSQINALDLDLNYLTYSKKNAILKYLP